ncbi:MAG TPA: hypothetical protein VFA71_08935 [Terriglobales bacterium]|nr:hypothetical protein [Terriglobales bacterium]
MKGKARIALLIAACIQSAWLAFVLWRGNIDRGKFVYAAVITALFAVFALSNGRYRWLNISCRVLIGLAFCLSVCDRFGLLGKNGASGISWGDFSHFIAYTQQVNSFLPATWAPLLAWLATVCETTLGLLLVSGLLASPAELAATLLLLLFGSAMIASLGVTSQFYYAVFVLACGAFYLHTLEKKR